MTSPSGWYLANDGSHERYWDGARWSEQTRPPTARQGPPPLPSSDRNRRVNQRALTRGGGWARRHKWVTALLVIMLLGSCSAVFSPDTATEGDAEESASPPEPSDSASEEPVEVPEEVVPAEPTAREVWLANYVDHEDGYLTTLLAVLGTKKALGSISASAVSTCRLIEKGRPLEKRVSRVGRAFTFKTDPAFPQSVAVINATVTSICPDMAEVHRSQLAERRAAIKQARAEARAAARAEARAQARAEARAAAKERQRQEQIRQQAAANEPSPTYYENCTAVENAGAAPIYAGEPGYSRDLDRDGDGVACEQ